MGMEKDRTLFEWRAPSSDFAQRFVIASLAAISIHGLCFYIFQVQKPEGPVALPRTDDVVLLRADDANAQLVLEQIDDFYAGYTGTLLANSDLNERIRSLDYAPAFEGWEIELKSMEGSAPPSLATLGPADSPMTLPEVPAWESTMPEDEGVRLAPGLRLVTVPQAWEERFQASEGVDWLRIAENPPLGGQGHLGWKVDLAVDGSVAELQSIGGQTSDQIVEGVLKDALRFSEAELPDNLEERVLEAHLYWDALLQGGAEDETQTPQPQ